MQLAPTLALAPKPTTANPPAAWAALDLGSVTYTATLTHLDLFETPEDPDNSFSGEDVELWTETGTSGIRTTGALGAREGYATLAEATKALKDLTDNAVSDLGPDELLETTGSAPLASARAGAVLEHAGRFYGYALDRDFAATEAFEIETQVEDDALYDGARYDVALTAREDTNATLRAIVDGYSAVYQFGA